MDRVDELNDRIASRLQADAPPMVFSPRPVSTKYVLFPVIDTVAQSRVPIESRLEPTYLPAQRAPFSSYMDRVEDETTLFNLRAAIQRDVRVGYVPASTSDLYAVSVPESRSIQTHPRLFSSVVASKQKLPETSKIFNNVTLRPELSK